MARRTLAVLVAGGLMAVGFGTHLSYAADPPVAIYIGAQQHDGFVDVNHDIGDSIKDIRDKFRASRQFRVVSAPEQAEITLSVVGRTKDEPANSLGGANGVTVGVGAVVVLNPQKCQCRTIYTVLRAGPYETSITSHKTNSDSFRATASYVLRDVTAWVEANREELARQRN